jgi:hypothetical protein
VLKPEDVMGDVVCAYALPTVFGRMFRRKSVPIRLPAANTAGFQVAHREQWKVMTAHSFCPVILI